MPFRSFLPRRPSTQSHQRELVVPFRSFLLTSNSRLNPTNGSWWCPSDPFYPAAPRINPTNGSWWCPSDPFYPAAPRPNPTNGSWWCPSDPFYPAAPRLNPTSGSWWCPSDPFLTVRLSPDPGWGIFRRLTPGCGLFPAAGPQTTLITHVSVGISVALAKAD